MGHHASRHDHAGDPQSVLHQLVASSLAERGAVRGLCGPGKRTCCSPHRKAAVRSIQAQCWQRNTSWLFHPAQNNNETMKNRALQSALRLFDSFVGLSETWCHLTLTLFLNTGNAHAGGLAFLTGGRLAAMGQWRPSSNAAVACLLGHLLLLFNLTRWPGSCLSSHAFQKKSSAPPGLSVVI